MKRLFLLLTLFIALNCSSQNYHKENYATVLIENRTTSPVDVFLDGYFVGTVFPATVKSFSYLTPGKTVLSAISKDKKVKIKRVLNLAPESRIFIVVALKKGKQEVFEPSQKKVIPVGDFVIFNKYPYEFSVYLDGKFLGTLFENEKRVFKNILAGKHVLTISAVSWNFKKSVPIVIKPESITKFLFKIPAGNLLIKNGFSEKFIVKINDKNQFLLDKKQEKLIKTIPAGRVLINATGLLSKRVFKGSVVIKDGETVEFNIKGKSGSILIVNFLNEPVVVLFDREKKIKVLPKKTVKIDKVSSGLHTLVAKGEKGDVIEQRKIFINSNEVETWEIHPSRTVFKVVNLSVEKVLIFINGKEWGKLDPGESRTFLLKGRIKVEAKGLSSHQIVRKTFLIKSGKEIIFKINFQYAELLIKNTLDEGVMVFKNNSFFAMIPAKKTKVFSDVIPGNARFKAVSEKSGKLSFFNAKLEKGKKYRWIIKDVYSTLVVKNNSGERLKCPPLLKNQRKMLYPDEEFSFKIPPRATSIPFLGMKTGIFYTKKFNFKPQKSYRWEINKATGTIEVFNNTPDEVSIYINKTFVSKIKPFNRKTFKSVEAGKIFLLAVKEKSKNAIKKNFFLSPHKTVYVVLKRHLSKISIFNDLAETVKVYIDGLFYTTMSPGEVRIFKNIAPGEREVKAVSTKSGAIFIKKIRLKEGEVYKLKLLSKDFATATLKISNMTKEKVKIFVNKKFKTTLNPDASITLFIPSGKDIITITGRKHSFNKHINALAGKVYDLKLKYLGTMLEFKNSTQFGLKVFVKDTFVAALKPGEKKEVLIKCPAKMTVLKAYAGKDNIFIKRFVCLFNQKVLWNIDSKF